MLSVMGAFAEFERSLIRERQKEGIALAKQRGAYKGRKKTLTPERAAELVQGAGSGISKSRPCPRLRDQQGDRIPVSAPSHDVGNPLPRRGKPLATAYGTPTIAVRTGRIDVDEETRSILSWKPGSLARRLASLSFRDYHE
jgi:hypothetical protein